VWDDEIPQWAISSGPAMPRRPYSSDLTDAKLTRVGLLLPPVRMGGWARRSSA
jgi:hypothetical protein